MGKKLRCEFDVNDFVKVKGNIGAIFVEGEFEGSRFSIVLTPEKAKKLRKQLKKAISAIEKNDLDGCDACISEITPQNEPVDDWFSVGKKVRIIENNTAHDFPIGEIVSISEKSGISSATACYLDGHDFWFIAKQDCEPV